MRQEKTKHPIHKGPNVTGSADIQSLTHNIITAHEKGALFFLAVQLAPLLEEHCKKNEAVTPVELETLIARATKTLMLGG